MLKSKFSKKLIKSFAPKNIGTVLPSKDADLFYYQIPISIKKSLSINISKIQILCQTKDSFNDSFSSIFYNKTVDYKSYQQTEDISSVVGESAANNVFLSYNKKSGFPRRGFFEEILFNTNKFVYKDSDDGNEDLYNINLPVDFSRKLFNNNIKNIRITFIDDRNNIVDNTDVLTCDFVNIKKSNKIIDVTLFYKNYFLNKFIDTMSFAFDEKCTKIILDCSGEIDSSMFSEINLRLSYGEGNKIISCVNNSVSTSNYPYNITDSVTELAFLIANKFIEGDDNFVFTVYAELMFNANKKDLDQANNSIILSKQIVMTRNAREIIKCYNINKKKMFSNLFKKLKLKQEAEFLNNSIKNSLSISSIIPESVLKQIFIDKIYLNNLEVIDVYRSAELTLENKLSYSGKSIHNLFENNNTFSFHVGSSNRQNRFKIILKFLDNFASFNSNGLISRKDFSSKIDKTNKLFKRNVQIAGIKLNSELDRDRKSLFDFNDISLANVSEFNDIAFSLGYILNNQGDIKEFLENCIVKIDNATSILELGIISNKTNYFFLKELFNTSTMDSGIISIRDNYLEDFIESNDHFQLSNLKKTSANKSLVKFFTLNNREDASKFLIRSSSLNIENVLTIKVLPLPKIIARFRGFGKDTLDNPVNDSLHDDIANLATEKRNLMRELVVFLYTGNSNLNWSKFNKFKNILLDKEKVDNVNNYSDIFDELLNLNVLQSSIYKNNTSYDRNEILSMSSINDIFLNSSIQTNVVEENLFQNYYDFSKNNREFYISDMPYRALFKDITYSSALQENSVRSLEVIKDSLEENILIDITYLDSFYEREKILSARPIIRMSLHFMMTNFNESLEENSMSIDNTDFIMTDYAGRKYVTFNNKYVEKNSSYFSNIKNPIDNSLIEVKNKNNRLVIEIKHSNRALDINSINFDCYSRLLDFCKDNNASYLSKILLRLSISFDIPQTEDFITCMFSANIPYVNLNNKKINFDKLSKIKTLIVT